MVKENKKNENNSGAVELIEKPEEQLNEIQEKETKPKVEKEDAKQEEKPAVIKEKETKPAVIEDKEKSPTIVDETTANAKNVLSTFGILVAVFIGIIVLLFLIFSFFMGNNNNIHNGVYIKNIDVSSLSKDEAKNKIEKYINANIPEEIILKHGDFETAIPTADLNISFAVNDAVDTAYNLGRSGFFLADGFETFSIMIVNKNVEPIVTIDEEALTNILNDISSKLPDKLIESGYYIEGNNLILNKGSIGNVINTQQMSKSIKEEIKNLNLKNNKISILTNEASPSKLNIDEIYDKVHIEPTNASYTAQPLTFTPSKNGVDFDISLDDAKNKLAEAEKECVIPLKVVYPSITTNMIGAEAFPDVLSDFSTNYYAGNYNRTTNLILAADKINGTVLMPGEEFSYNKVVGERTIAAGYKEAPIYVEGRVEDGLGGGICQITTTLYNAVVYANLEVTERTNHQFVPSYISAGKDATVVYGAIDFKFKNNRNYPIKIVCSVEGGVANFKILGFRTPDDYDVEIAAWITGQSANYTNSVTYKNLYKDGVLVDQVLLSTDIYKNH